MQTSSRNIKKSIVAGVFTILLLVLGFLLWTVRSQHYELITLRAAYVSDQSDLDSMRKTISALSMEAQRAAIHAQKQEQALKQYEKMVEEEKSLFGDSIIRRDYILDENDPFVATLGNYGQHEDGYYTSEGYYEYANRSIIYSDHWIISYRLCFDTAWGHGTTRVKVGTINRNAMLDSFYRFEKPGAASNSYFLSRRLKLSDIAAKDDIPRMTALLIEPFKNELDKKGFKYEIKEDGSLHTGFPMPKPTENFYYDKDGLHFVYESYEIHCGAAGSFDLCIEWPLPESVVWGHRGAGTRTLPEEWPIPPKIAPLPEKPDWDTDAPVRFERILSEDGIFDEALNIYSGDRLSFSHNVNHEHIGFMKYDGDDGEDSFKTVFCSFEEPFDYHDYLLDMKGDGDYRYLILGDLSTGTAAIMEGYLLDVKDDFAVVGEIPVREFISYPKHNHDLIFDFFERIQYFGWADGGYIHIKMKLQKGKSPQYVETEKCPFSIKEFEEKLLGAEIVKKLSSKDDTGFHFNDPVLLCKEVAFHKLCGELFSNGELDKLHDYAKQMGYSEEEIRKLENECMARISGCSLFKYVHDNFKNVW